MKLLSEMDIAEKINHPFFTGDDVSIIAKKKRVRKLARNAQVKPVIKKHNIWLFHENDLEMLLRCRSDLQNEKIRRTGRSRARTAESAFVKARRLTTEN